MKTQLKRLAVLLLYVVVAGAVFFGIEHVVGARIRETSKQGGPSVDGVWVLDLLIFGVVLAAVIRDDLTDFIHQWMNPGTRSSRGVLRLMAYSFLVLLVLGVSAALVAELKRRQILT